MKPRHTPRLGSASRRKPRPGGSKEREQTAARQSDRCLALERFSPEPGAVFTIETAARLAGVPRRRILIYCKHKLVAPVGEPSVSGYWFTTDAIRSLREIQEVRARCRDEVETVTTVLNLVNEIKALRAALREQPSARRLKTV